MGKLDNSLYYSAVGVVGGIAGTSATGGLCSGSPCSACFRCAGMGLILVAVALWKKQKRSTSHGLAQRSN